MYIFNRSIYEFINISLYSLHRHLYIYIYIILIILILIFFILIYLKGYALTPFSIRNLLETGTFLGSIQSSLKKSVKA